VRLSDPGVSENLSGALNRGIGGPLICDEINDYHIGYFGIIGNTKYCVVAGPYAENVKTGAIASLPCRKPISG